MLDDKASQILKQVREEKRVILTEIEAKELLKEAGIPSIETKLARNKKEAIVICKEIGFPVVLKIASPDIVHKSDANGVILDIKSATEAGRAYSKIINSAKVNFPQATIQGISVQKMAPPGVEVIIGMSKDPQFGPVLMFGLGGIFVEILKDVSFRIVPLTQKDAKEMIREIKGYPLLEGYRGQKPANVPALEDMLLNLSEFVDKNPEIKEIDLNPVFAYPDKAMAVDARVILENSKVVL